MHLSAVFKSRESGDESPWNSVARVLFLEFWRRVLLVPDKGEKRDDCPTRLSVFALSELRRGKNGGILLFFVEFSRDKIGYGKMMFSFVQARGYLVRGGIEWK